MVLEVVDVKGSVGGAIVLQCSRTPLPIRGDIREYPIHLLPAFVGVLVDGPIGLTAGPYGPAYLTPGAVGIFPGADVILMVLNAPDLIRKACYNAAIDHAWTCVSGWNLSIHSWHQMTGRAVVRPGLILHEIKLQPIGSGWNGRAIHAIIPIGRPDGRVVDRLVVTRAVELPTRNIEACIVDLARLGGKAIADPVAIDPLAVQSHPAAIDCPQLPRGQGAFGCNVRLTACPLGPIDTAIKIVG